MDGLQWKTLFKWMIWGYPYLYTLPETNGLHLKIEFAKRTFCLPTIDFQGPCQFQGGYIYIYSRQGKVFVVHACKYFILFQDCYVCV